MIDISDAPFTLRIQYEFIETRCKEGVRDVVYAWYTCVISMKYLAECILFIHTTTNINRGWLFYAASSFLCEYCFHPWICRFRYNLELFHFS